MPVVKNKPAYASKTMWYALAVALLPLLESVLGVLSAVGLDWPWVVAAIGGGIALLRWLTERPLSLTGGDVTRVDDGTPPRGL